MPLTAMQTAPWKHRFTPEQMAILEKEMAPTIAGWLRRNRITYYRPYDLDRLIPLYAEDIAERAGDPDRDFAASAVQAAAHTEANIASLVAAMRAERLRGIANRWNYDIARHAQLVRAHAAETLILVWISRAINIRGGIPSIGDPELTHA
jgi:hypothetical protein